MKTEEVITGQVDTEALLLPCSFSLLHTENREYFSFLISLPLYKKCVYFQLCDMDKLPEVRGD